jgi:hypothetical protein
MLNYVGFPVRLPLRGHSTTWAPGLAKRFDCQRNYGNMNIQDEKVDEAWAGILSRVLLLSRGSWGTKGKWGNSLVTTKEAIIFSLTACTRHFSIHVWLPAGSAPTRSRPPSLIPKSLNGFLTEYLLLVSFAWHYSEIRTYSDLLPVSSR